MFEKLNGKIIVAGLEKYLTPVTRFSAGSIEGRNGGAANAVSPGSIAVGAPALREDV
jgi:hypothetical protein